MRLFIAIPFDEDARDRLCAIQERLRASARRGSFSRRENLHLTLAFLGEVDPGRLSRARRAIEAVPLCPLTLRFDAAGRFSRGGGDLWWAGINRSPALLRLWRELCAALRGEGFSLEDRSFTPHVTLAREVRLSGPVRAGALLGEPFSTAAGRISLMRSQRLRGALTYTELFSRACAAHDAPDGNDAT